MTNTGKYNQVFIETFSLAEALLPSAEYSKLEGWDSIGHMQLIAALEEAFGITLETDDIISFSSYSKGFEILAKYQVDFAGA